MPFATFARIENKYEETACWQPSGHNDYRYMSTLNPVVGPIWLFVFQICRNMSSLSPERPIASFETVGLEPPQQEKVHIKTAQNRRYNSICFHIF